MKIRILNKRFLKEERLLFAKTWERLNWGGIEEYRFNLIMRENLKKLFYKH